MNLSFHFNFSSIGLGIVSFDNIPVANELAKEHPDEQALLTYAERQESPEYRRSMVLMTSPSGSTGRR